MARIYYYEWEKTSESSILGSTVQNAYKEVRSSDFKIIKNNLMLYALLSEHVRKVL